MEKQQRPPAEAADPATLRSQLEKAARDKEKEDIGVTTSGICGPI